MISAGEPYLHDVIIADRASLIEGTVAAANLINPRSRYRPFRMKGWWSQTDSNRRHPACKAGALPTELWPLTSGELLKAQESWGRWRPYAGGW